MRTLYTGHVTIGTRTIYSFTYAETLYEAEERLAEVLEGYIRERYRLAASLILPRLHIVSRPNGWHHPAGYYLPGTGRQYTLRYAVRSIAGGIREGTIYESEGTPSAASAGPPPGHES
jgi:hypothetical protein